VQQQPEQAQERHDDHARLDVDDVGFDHDQYDSRLRHDINRRDVHGL
jgi:hypothetical protein